MHFIRNEQLTFEQNLKITLTFFIKKSQMLQKKTHFLHIKI